MSLALWCRTLHLPADAVGHFLLFQKLIHHVCAAGSGCVTPDEPLSWSVSAIPGHSGQQDRVLPMEAAPGKPREIPRIALVHTVVTGQGRLSYSTVRRFCQESVRSALEVDNLRQGVKAFE